MKHGSIYLIDYKGVTNLVAFAMSREILFNGKNGESFKFLVVSVEDRSRNVSRKVSIYYSDFITGKVNDEVIVSECEYSVASFLEEYKEEAVSVKLFLDKNNLDYSWLTHLQLSALYRNNKNHEENNTALGLFHEQEFLDHNSD